MTVLSISASKMMHPPDKDVRTFVCQESIKKNDGKKKGEELLNSEKKYMCA